MTRISRFALISALLLGCGDDDTSTAGGGRGTGGGNAGGSNAGGSDAGGSDAGGGEGGGVGGQALPAGYECLGNVQLEDPGAASLDVDLVLAAATGNVAGADVLACARTDAACAAPVATGVTDAEGHVTLQLPMGEHGFDGYAQVSGAGLFPELIQGSAPLIPEAGTTYTYIVYDGETLAPLLQQAFGINLDPAKGQIQIVVNDCDGSVNAGVAISVDGAESLVYVQDQNPVDATATTADGQALAINVPPGDVTISATIDGSDVVFAETTALVRAGTLTLFFLSPTP